MSKPVIVVGIDGSEGSRRALRWAIEEARLHHSTVEAVTVWPARGEPDVTGERAEEVRRHTDEMQRHVLEKVIGEFEAPPTVAYQVVHGDVVEVLVRLSTGALFLAIGSHGTAEARHAALGSVSEACAQNAACPVVVLPVTSPSAEHGALSTTQPPGAA